MMVYLTKPEGRIILMLRAEAADGQVIVAIGDAIFEVRPGDSAFGRTFAQWMALPPGPYDAE